MLVTIGAIQLPSVNRAAYRARYSGQPSSSSTPSRTACQPGPCRSRWRCSSSTRVRSGASAMKRDLDLAGVVRVGLDLPLRADVPAEHHPVRRLVGEDPRPAALAAVGAAVVDVAADPRLEHGLGDRRPSRLCSGGLKSPNRSVNTAKARSIGASTTICLRTTAVSVVRHDSPRSCRLDDVAGSWSAPGARTCRAGRATRPRRRVQPVDPPGAHRPLGDQAGVLEHLQVLRHRRPADRQRVGQLAHRPRPLGQARDDGAAGWDRPALPSRPGLGKWPRTESYGLRSRHVKVRLRPPFLAVSDG